VGNTCSRKPERVCPVPREQKGGSQNRTKKKEHGNQMVPNMQRGIMADQQSQGPKKKKAYKKGVQGDLELNRKNEGT